MLVLRRDAKLPIKRRSPHADLPRCVTDSEAAPQEKQRLAKHVPVDGGPPSDLGATGACGFDPGSGAFDDEGAFKMGDSAQDMQHELTKGGADINLFTEGPEGDIAGMKADHHIRKVAHGHQHDTTPERSRALLIAREYRHSLGQRAACLAPFFGAVAEFERNLIIERTKAGLAAAKARGSLVGRPRKLNDEKISEALLMLARGASLSEVACIYKVSSLTLYRYKNLQ